jgi:small-conductance mechanosensitive channel
MNHSDYGLSAFILQFRSSFEQFWAEVLTPVQLSQFALLLGLMGVAYGVEKFLRPRLEEWGHDQASWPRWRLRLFVLFSQRLKGLLFSLLAWSAVYFVDLLVGKQATNWVNWVEIAATLSTAWIGVSLAARIIRNRFLRRVTIWAVWGSVTLIFLDLLEPTLQILDSIALSFKGSNISILDLLKALLVLVILIMVSRLVTSMVSRQLSSNDDISPSMQVLAIKLVQLLVSGVALFIGLSVLGVDLTGIAVLSGAIGLGLGFGLQKVVSNLVSGVIILLDKSIKPGDVISLGDTFGWINSLGARYVSVVTRDGREYLIPNEDLITAQVVNWSHSDEFVRLDLKFSTSYDDDPHVVRRIAVDAAKGVQRILSDRPVACHITAFGESGIDYVLRFWIKDAVFGLASVRGDVYLALWDTFKQQGISIPFPQREVRIVSQPETVD